MSINDRNLVFRILNVWLAFVLMLFVSSHLSHWPKISIHSWLNEAFYFLLFLLALFIAVKEKNNRDIFINLTIYLFIYFISVVNIFMGENYLLGGGNVTYYYYHYKKLAFSFLLNLIIIYPVIKYIFIQSKKWVLYSITIGIIVPIFILNFHSVLFKPDFYIYNHKNFHSNHLDFLYNG